MKRQKHQVYTLFMDAVIGLLFLHVFMPLTAASSHDDAIFLPLPAAKSPGLTQTGLPILPEWEAPLDPDFTQNVPVVYDHRTGTTETQRPYPVCKSCISDETDYQKPYETPNFIFNDEPGNDLYTSEITQNPEMWPNSPTVRIIAVWPSGKTSACSGMLVQKAHILTAAHCTFTHSPENCIGEKSCWVEDLQIYNDANPDVVQPASFIKILTWTDWTENRDYAGDLACVALTSPLGEEIGWLGFGYHNDPSKNYFPSASFEYTSYPVESPYNGETMTTWRGQFNKILEHQFYSADPSQEGQSGASSHCPDANHVIYSVVSHTFKISNDSLTSHTRITSDKFYAIRDWINGGIKDLPFQHYLPVLVQ